MRKGWQKVNIGDGVQDTFAPFTLLECIQDESGKTIAEQLDGKVSKAGDTMTGSLRLPSITTTDTTFGVRLRSDSFSAWLVNNGYGFHILLTNVNDPDGYHNDFRPLTIDPASGRVVMENGVDVIGNTGITGKLDVRGTLKVVDDWLMVHSSEPILQLVNKAPVPLNVRLYAGTAQMAYLSVFNSGDDWNMQRVMSINRAANNAVAFYHDVEVAGDLRANSAFYGKSITTTEARAMRIKFTDWSTMFVHDGTNFYIMLTNKGDPDGNFNSWRPFYISGSTGRAYLGNGATINGGLVMDTPLGISYGGMGANTAEQGYKNLSYRGRAPANLNSVYLSGWYMLSVAGTTGAPTSLSGVSLFGILEMVNVNDGIQTEGAGYRMQRIHLINRDLGTIWERRRYDAYGWQPWYKFTGVQD